MISPFLGLMFCFLPSLYRVDMKGLLALGRLKRRQLSYPGAVKPFLALTPNLRHRRLGRYESESKCFEIAGSARPTGLWGLVPCWNQYSGKLIWFNMLCRLRRF